MIDVHLIMENKIKVIFHCTPFDAPNQWLWVMSMINVCLIHFIAEIVWNCNHNYFPIAKTDQQSAKSPHNLREVLNSLFAFSSCLLSCVCVSDVQNINFSYTIWHASSKPKIKYTNYLQPIKLTIFLVWNAHRDRDTLNLMHVACNSILAINFITKIQTN